MDYEQQATELAAQAVARLAQRGQSLGLAESCTGGRLASAITSIPGASDVLPGAVVSYANRIKQALLGVSAQILQEHGAVSAECAAAMARGAQAALGGDWAIAVTGIAGPGGGSADKPVGLVYIAWAGPPSSAAAEPLARRFQFTGDRAQVQWQSVVAALEGLLGVLSSED